MTAPSTIRMAGAPPPPPDDRVLATTRWVSIAVIPVLVAAFVILFVFAGHSRQFWGWTIAPRMSEIVMGAGYLSGAYLFLRVAGTREWHRVGNAFVAVTVFSTVLIVTTVLHWDRFNYDHVSFWAWLLLYGSTPVLLPVLWARNRRTDPRRPSPAGDVVVPRRLRLVVGTGGVIQLAVAAVMFFRPDVAIDVWPWPVTVPSSRSLAAFVAFPAVTWLWFFFDDRWSSFRITQQTATLGLVLVGLGALRVPDDFRGDGPYAAVYGATLVGAVVLNVALYLAMERRALRARAED